MPTNLDNLALSNLIEAASFAPQWLKEPYSWVGHIPFVSWLVQVDKPKIIVEMGTHSGNSYFSICQAVKQYDTGSKCYAVDTWQGDAHALAYGEEIYEMVRKHNEENYASFSTLLRMTFDEALSHFEDRSVDLLHIDGLHTYEAVKHDFETWLPKLASDATVLFHDTNVRRDDFGVWKYWGELRVRYNCTIEFSHSFGLGVLKLNNGSSKNIFTPLFGKSSQHFFQALGDAYELSENKYQKIFMKSVPYRLFALARQNQLLRDKISSITASKSWVMTQPVRFVDELIKKTLLRKKKK